MPFTVVITGASAGIGEALALQCAHAGYSVALLARRENELQRVKQLCDDIYKKNNNITDTKSSIHVIDVSQKSQWESIFPSILEQHNGIIDVLVNNAGLGSSLSPLNITDDELDTMINVNVRSVIYGCQYAVKHYIDTRGVGQIINVSSVLGRLPSVPYRCTYSMAKHAVNSYTATLREEVADMGYGGISICLFSPGIVGTEFGLNAKTMDNRLLPGAQDVNDTASILLQQINTGKAISCRELQRVKDGPVEEVSPSDGMFPESQHTMLNDKQHTSVYDVYSRPSYKNDVVEYISCDNIALYERQKRAIFRDELMKLNAQRTRLAASENNKTE